MPEQPLPIHDIRSISRRLVRELGFMGGDFAGTDLPPSAVHALIEIEACPGITARDLAKLLRLEKSSVSRMLRKLVLSGDLLEETDIDDSRIKRLRLTKPGHNRVGTIHAFANWQVSSALTRIGPAQALTVLEGLRLYADALGDRGDVAAPAVEVIEGYRPGLIARITQMRRLLETALAFVDKNGFAATHLWTFNGLSTARHLYETHGFTCVEEYPGSQWGSEVLEQRFVRRRPG